MLVFLNPPPAPLTHLHIPPLQLQLRVPVIHAGAVGAIHPNPLCVDLPGLRNVPLAHFVEARERVVQRCAERSEARF